MQRKITSMRSISIRRVHSSIPWANGRVPPFNATGIRPPIRRFPQDQRNAQPVLRQPIDQRQWDRPPNRYYPQSPPYVPSNSTPTFRDGPYNPSQGFPPRWRNRPQFHEVPVRSPNTIGGSHSNFRPSFPQDQRNGAYRYDDGQRNASFRPVRAPVPHVHSFDFSLRRMPLRIDGNERQIFKNLAPYQNSSFASWTNLLDSGLADAVINRLGWKAPSTLQSDIISGFSLPRDTFVRTVGAEGSTSALFLSLLRSMSATNGKKSGGKLRYVMVVEHDVAVSSLHRMLHTLYPASDYQAPHETIAFGYSTQDLQKMLETQSPLAIVINQSQLPQLLLRTHWGSLRTVVIDNLDKLMAKRPLIDRITYGESFVFRFLEHISESFYGALSNNPELVVPTKYIKVVASTRLFAGEKASRYMRMKSFVQNPIEISSGVRGNKLRAIIETTYIEEDGTVATAPSSEETASPEFDSSTPLESRISVAPMSDAVKDGMVKKLVDDVRTGNVARPIVVFDPVQQKEEELKESLKALLDGDASVQTANELFPPVLDPTMAKIPASGGESLGEKSIVLVPAWKANGFTLADRTHLVYMGLPLAAGTTMQGLSLLLDTDVNPYMKRLPVCVYGPVNGSYWFERFARMSTRYSQSDADGEVDQTQETEHHEESRKDASEGDKNVNESEPENAEDQERIEEVEARN